MKNGKKKLPRVKDSYYEFVSFIVFKVNYSNAYRLRAEASLVNSAFSSNLLLIYTQYSQRINLSAHCYINSEYWSLLLVNCLL